jgi:hypothetical protein
MDISHNNGLERGKNCAPLSPTEQPKGGKEMKPASSTFETFADLWQVRYRAARGGEPDVPDVRETEDFIQKKSESEQVFQCLRPLGESFLNLVKGFSPGVSNAERAVRGVLCFFPKFFRVGSISQLPSSTSAQLSDATDETHLLGLASHLILFNHPHRHRIESVDKVYLYSKFLEVCGAADAEMRSYNKDVHGIPEAVFQDQFREAVEPMLKNDLKIGFWKMGKLRSHFRNIFFAGTILGVLADTHAAEA